MSSLRYFFSRLNNIRRWIPILWDDDDWDFACVYRLWAAKFGFMAQYFKEHGITEDAEEMAEQMAEAFRLSLALADDHYGSIANAELERRWGEPTWDFSKANSKGFRSVSIIYPGVKTPEDEKALNKAISGAWEEEERLRNQDRDRLFDLLLDHLENWWS